MQTVSGEAEEGQILPSFGNLISMTQLLYMSSKFSSWCLTLLSLSTMDKGGSVLGVYLGNFSQKSVRNSCKVVQVNGSTFFTWSLNLRNTLRGRAVVPGLVVGDEASMHG